MFSWNTEKSVTFHLDLFCHVIMRMQVVAETIRVDFLTEDGKQVTIPEGITAFSREKDILGHDNAFHTPINKEIKIYYLGVFLVEVDAKPPIELLDVYVNIELITKYDGITPAIRKKRYGHGPRSSMKAYDD